MKYDAMLSQKRRALLGKMLGKDKDAIHSQRIPPRPDDLHIVPLSFAQQRLWLLDQLEPGTTLYNMPVILHAWGQLDRNALAQSVNEVIRRHEILRTTLRVIDEQPAQIIAPERFIDLPVYDLQAFSDEKRREITYQKITAEIAQPFDLANGPLLRMALFQLAAEEYAILLTMHHVISDGWSMTLLCQEIIALYRALRHDLPSPLAQQGSLPPWCILPPLPIQYADFAVWQRQWLQGEVLERQKSYWQERLAHLPALEFPTDHPRPAAQSYRGRTLPFSLPRELSIALQTWSQDEGVSIFMTLLAAFQVLLGRYSRQVDFAIGTPVANRQRVEVQNLIGFFVNTLVLRADLHDNPTFRELVQRVRKTCLDAYAHQDLPFEQLVEILQPERELSRSPLFQVMLVFQNTPATALDIPGLRFEFFPIENESAKFDLSLSIGQTDEILECYLEYSTDLFDAATMQRLLANFQTLLEAILADPSQPIATIPLLTAAERHRLLNTWNATQVSYPLEVSLQAHIEAQVGRTPEAIAVAFEEQTLTYAELNQRANQLAHLLRAQGIGRDGLVGICMERSMDMVVGLLGILKAGGAYVPLDAGYPLERLAYMLEQSQVPILLTQERWLGLLEEMSAACGCKVLCLDRDWADVAAFPADNPLSHTRPDDLAYVIYTSGSTGKPKGAMNTQRGICNRLLWMQDAYHLTAQDRVLQKTPFSFDVSVWEFFWPLMTGARLVVARPEGHKDARYLMHLIHQQAITTLHFVPSMLPVFLDEPGLEHCQSLKRVICSGEALPYELQERFFERSNAELHNLYGPTEAAVDVSYWACQRNDPRQVVPIGRPIANTQLYVLDDSLQPVPVGAPGDIYIGGVGVGRGYLKQPELTGERFQANPFTGGPDRLYKTGDLGRWLPDGVIEYLGRSDFQVKIRGFRIELEEIEGALNQHPAVRECVVVAREDAAGEKRLVAYLVLAEDVEPSIGELRSFLKAHLPEYMIPAAFVFIEKMPLSPNGKLDRKLLPAPDQKHLKSSKDFVAARTPREITLAKIWCDLLGRKEVSVHDNFFELGGDSLLIMRIVARANQAGLPYTPRHFFQHQTIAELAEVEHLAPAVITQTSVTGTIPLTVCQGWFFGQGFHYPNRWNSASLFEVPNPIDLEKLKQALAFVMQHHDALRARFTYAGKRWQQHIMPPVEIAALPFSQVDLSDTPDDMLIAAIERAANELQNTLDISNGPLLRVAHFDLGPGRPGRLLFVLHHLICDSSSVLVLDDFQTAYQQLERGEAINLPLKTTSIKDWAEQLERYANSAEVRAELDYWLARPWEQLPALPVDFPNETENNTYNSVQSILTRFSQEETRLLFKQVPGQSGASVESVLWTALMQAITRWSRVPYFAFDAVDMGRTLIPGSEANLARTVGWFSLHRRIVLKQTTDDPMLALQETAAQLRAMPNQGRNFEVLLRCSNDAGITASLSQLPKTEMIFNFIYNESALQENGPEILPEDASPVTSLYSPVLEFPGWGQDLRDKRPYPLECLISVFGGRLTAKWSYSQNIHQRATLQKVAQDFAQALRAMITSCQANEHISS